MTVAASGRKHIAYHSPENFGILRITVLLLNHILNYMFTIARPTAKKSAIILQYSCADGRLKYYTGLSTPVTKAVKIRMNDIEKTVETLKSDLNLKGEPLTKQILSDALDRHLNGIKNITTFFDKIEDLINRMESGEVLTDNKKRFSALSIKTFRFTKKLLQEFKPGMTLSNITMKTYDEFIVWCQSEDRNYSTNYIGSQIKNWKSLCAKIGGSPVTESKDFKKITEEAYDIYTDEDELNALFKADLKNGISVARHWYIIGSYTGLRVSDLTILDKKNLDKFITVVNEKTDVQVQIPIHPIVKKILAIYKGFPPHISDQKLNDYIKLAAREAGIKQKVLHTITKGGIRRDQWVEKCDMISTHTGRRSFITNLLKNGTPDVIVMKLTGIKSHNTLKKYTKLSTGEAAKIAADLAFFK